MSVYVGLDIGGTKLLAGASDARGNVLRVVRRPTPLDLQAGLDLLNEMIRQATGQDRIAAIGAAVGGPLDRETGVVCPLHQPQWRQVPLKDLMERAWGCPFDVDVDTNVAALGEYSLGRYTERRFLYITLSTGMGGGFLVDGEVYRGAGGVHPEVGHQAVRWVCSHPERITCECGGGDCLEGLVSGNGIRRIYGRSAEQLDEAQWSEVAYNLGQGLRNLAAIYLPDVIVLGGGVAHGRGQRLIDAAGEVMRAHLKIVPAPKLLPSRLGYDTALMGALVLARQALRA